MKHISVYVHESYECSKWVCVCVCVYIYIYIYIYIYVCIHLIHLIPFGVQTFFDGLASKELITDQQHAIGVRLPFDQPAQICILNFQILSFKKMNP